MRSFVLLLAGLLLAAPAQAVAQGPPAATASVKVFLDCHFCDEEYLRVETPWVDFVRDRTASDVHLLLTRIETGGGGMRYDLEVIAQGRAQRDTVVFETASGSTGDERRREIVRNIQLALVPYALRTPVGRSLRLAAVLPVAEDDRPAVRGPDRWNAWVFEAGLSASLDGEERQSERQFNGRFNARRITSLLKLGFRANGEYERSRFELDEGGGTEISVREQYNAGAIAVRSIASKWGLGAEATAGSSTFQNTQLVLRAAPAIEYSVWPYEEATRRQLVFQYSIGVSSFQYREETIFDKMSEVRPNHALVVGYDLLQPWGSAGVSVEAASYLDDFAQHRLEFDAGLSLRITRGLNLQFGTSLERIKDQLAIVKRDLTPEEILLRRSALGTDYRYDVYLGFSYTFGSIFSSVINPRFGGGPGRILR